MTRVGWQGTSPRTWGDGVGIAAACLGIVLLAGTSLSSLMSSGPAFPAVSLLPPASESDSGERGVVVHRSAAKPATERGRGGTLGEPTQVALPQPVDINRADALVLQALPGVGPTLAQRIVAYRETHGPFREPQDLLQVPGIGAKRYARLHTLIRTAETP